MPPVVYAVVATLPDDQIASEYLSWLTGGHVQAVLRGGATEVSVVRISVPPIRIESRYVFPSQSDYERYLATVAAELRAEGLQRFPPERGIRFERSSGDLLLDLSGFGSVR